MSYNTEMQENNAELEEILEAVNELPEASGGNSASVMTGATATSAGTSGLVPAPAAGDQDKVLYGDGTWKDPPSGATGDCIPVPTTAEVGQTIRVSAVDENNKPTAWEAVDMASGGGAADEYVLVLSKVFEADALNTDEWGGESHLFGYNHFWTTDVDGNDLDIDGIYVRIHVPAQTGDSIVSSGELSCGVGKGKPTAWLSWRGHNQKQPYIGFPSFISSSGKEVWCTFDIDLRLQTYKAQRAESSAYNGNFNNKSVCTAPAFADAVARNNWDTLSGVQVDLVSGSLPTGTNILIYARKRNAEKVAALPKWSVIT